MKPEKNTLGGWCSLSKHVYYYVGMVKMGLSLLSRLSKKDQNGVLFNVFSGFPNESVIGPCYLMINMSTNNDHGTLYEIVHYHYTEFDFIRSSNSFCQ